jgi:Na+-driven multidrug efflux pump
MYYKQKRKIMMLAVLTTVTSIPCIYLFVKTGGGVQGAAWGVLISYIISFLLTCWFTREHIKKIFS